MCHAELGLGQHAADGLVNDDLRAARPASRSSGDRLAGRRDTCCNSRTAAGSRLPSPVTLTLAALMTTTKSPVSTCGVYVGRCLPIRMVATRAARRPSTLSVASTTYQRALSSPFFAM